MKILFKIIVFLYLLGCTGVYFMQEKIIFHPEHLQENYRFKFGEEIEIPLDDNLSMNTLLVRAQPGKRSKGAIIYYHGNRGSIRFGTHQIRTMKHLGLDILIPDYRSYGKTEGEIKSQKQLLNDASKAYAYLKQHYQEDKSYVVGYSLGTSMASYVASINQPAHLFLVAPFTSLTAIKNKYAWFIPGFLLKYKLPVIKFVKNVPCDISIIHGTNDKVVDYDFSTKIKDKYPDKTTLYTVEGQGHRRIIFDEALESALNKIILN